MLEKIHFYYTNDLHSYFEHWSRVATFMKMKRLESMERGESSWVVDIGDHVDRMSPITEATMGRANIELMNELNYDFATIGNNEGITLSHNQLYHLYDDANFELICSNLISTDSDNPPWLRTHKIVQSNKGIRIGIVGLTARFNPYYNLLGWHLNTIRDTLKKELSFLTDKTDVIILLSHLGIHEDYTIAENFPEIDVIIGGHTHHLLRSGEYVNNTLLTAAGKHCAHVGEVTITWDHNKEKIVEKVAHTTEIADFHRDLQTEQRIGELLHVADVILSKEIIRTKEPIKVNWFQESEIMQLFTEKLREWAEADICMLNAGLLLDEFPAGEITYFDVHRICPHPINPCVVTLSGAELTEVVHDVLSKSFMELKLKGFGFRGEVIGRMIFSQLDIETAFTDDGTEYVEAIYYKNEPLQLKQQYRIVTADTFTFGRLLPAVAQAEEKQLFLPEFLREILVLTLIHYKDHFK